MSLLSSLAREHRLMERLMDRLEAGIAPEAGVDGARLARLLEPLTAALGAHEELEGRVYAAANDAAAVQFLPMVERQHRELGEIRRELAAEIAQASAGERLRALARLYLQGLRYHFQTEETRLWPEFFGKAGRSMGRSIELAAARRVRELERLVEG